MYRDIWLRKYHELWEKLEVNTKISFSAALWKWLVQQNLCIASQPSCRFMWFSEDMRMHAGLV